MAKNQITLFRKYFGVYTRIGEQDMFIKLDIYALENNLLKLAFLLIPENPKSFLRSVQNHVT